jgi:HSP20 family protein
MRDRDLFANFDRMRREMDALFGDVLGRNRLAVRGRGFSPAVDVVYIADPPRAIVTAELAGVSLEHLDLEIRGRELILSGTRAPAQSEGELYQQIEIERGAFRRTVQLGAEAAGEQATASYEDGMLRVELPLVREPGRLQTIPIQSGEAE